MKPLLTAVLLVLAMGLVSACAAPRGAVGERGTDNQAGATSGGVEVFGTIDAGVSRTRSSP
ncbi:MAG: hypothetical protein JWQ03_1425 [Variovorax sp.]|nr:hypothetical protein [Variovorax sp.]